MLLGCTLLGQSEYGKCKKKQKTKLDYTSNLNKKSGVRRKMRNIEYLNTIREMNL